MRATFPSSLPAPWSFHIVFLAIKGLGYTSTTSDETCCWRDAIDAEEGGNEKQGRGYVDSNDALELRLLSCWSTTNGATEVLCAATLIAEDLSDRDANLLVCMHVDARGAGGLESLLR